MDHYELEPEDVLYLLSIGRDDVAFSDLQIEEASLCLLDLIAIKAAGGDHMVHWEASEMCH